MFMTDYFTIHANISCLIETNKQTKKLQLEDITTQDYKFY